MACNCPPLYKSNCGIKSVPAYESQGPRAEICWIGPTLIHIRPANTKVPAVEQWLLGEVFGEIFDVDER